VLGDSSHYAAKQTHYARSSGAFDLAWLPGVVLLCLLLPLFISLGMWQLDKWRYKTGLQQERERLATKTLVNLPSRVVDPETLRFRRISVSGDYVGAQQFLVDNQVHLGRAGYHVITPLRIKNSNLHVLINRGWVSAAADRNNIPIYPPPAGERNIRGIAIIPSTRFFTLGDTTPEGNGRLWQHLDLSAFAQRSSLNLHDVVLQLDADVEGGYTRQWPRLDERSAKNLSYALQWFGFAFAAVAIQAYLWVKRRNKQSLATNSQQETAA